MFAFPNVFHFFAHKLASLSAGRFAFALVFACAFHCFFFWHNKMVTPLERNLDVDKSMLDEKTLCIYVESGNTLSLLLCLIPDQAFRHGWSLACSRLEFLAAGIVVRNKEMLNFGYQLGIELFQRF